jgi:hypothetical protein
MSDDFFDKAIEQLDDALEVGEAESGADDWDPTEGDVLRGIFLKASVIPTKYGPAILAIVRDLEDERSLKVWCTRSVLKSEILESIPKPGSKIVIRYSGERTAKSGNMFHLYQVASEKMDADYWGPLLRAIHAPQSPRAAAKKADFVPPDEAPF